jgi:hypothetical protein
LFVIPYSSKHKKKRGNRNPEPNNGSHNKNQLPKFLSNVLATTEVERSQVMLDTLVNKNKFECSGEQDVSPDVQEMRI